MHLIMQALIAITATGKAVLKVYLRGYTGRRAAPLAALPVRAR